ncbi:MAG: hypothetical protein CBB71_01485 [Rhodopirellula sp. TMED11]|nr:MAG: hypothetical protein CBB71_01485 [Rhodopirellula sp. TMED11]
MLVSIRPLVATLLLSIYGLSAHAGFTIGFESSEGYSLGPISNTGSGDIQGGWSGGAQAFFTNDSTDNEQIVDTEAHSGSQSWHAAKFYGSPGQGTPFTPSLGLPDGTGPGITLHAELYFKAGSSAGDGSAQNIYLGTYAGDDRTGFNVYLNNNEDSDGGLTVSTYDWNGDFVNEVIASALARDQWHKLKIVARFHETDSLQDSFTYTVNDTESFTGNSWPNPWRNDKGFTEVWGDTLKFAETSDDETDLGFYYDDLSLSVASAVVPEPGMLGIALMGILTVASRRRRSC